MYVCMHACPDTFYLDFIVSILLIYKLPHNFFIFHLAFCLLVKILITSSWFGTCQARPSAISVLQMVDLAGREGIISEHSPGVFLQVLLFPLSLLAVSILLLFRLNSDMKTLIRSISMSTDAQLKS